MNVFRPHSLVVLAVLVGAWRVGFADSTALVSGRIVNRTAACGDAVSVAVQLMGAEMSPRIEVAADGELPVSLPRGLYGVAVIAEDGTLLEESRTLIGGPGFLVPAGCPTIPFARTASDGGQAAEVGMNLVNSSGDCGRPESVEFFLDGNSLGSVPPGGRVTRRAASRTALIEAFVEGRRALSWTHPPLGEGGSLTYGCTYPELLAGTSGIPVAFENTTDTCTDPSQHRFLTLWIDGVPVVGVAPGQRTGVRVEPGKRSFQVFVGMSQERVVRGVKDVQTPFRIHFGCGR